MTTYAQQAGAGVGGDIRPTLAERAIWPLFAPFEKSKSALWLQAHAKTVPSTDGSPPKVYPYTAYATALDTPADFWMLDRASRRRFIKASTLHPKNVLDGVTGRGIILCAGVGQGSMICPSILDGSGAEANDKPMFVPGTGYSYAVKFRCPAPSATLFGTTFDANAGGILIGGSSSTNGSNFAVRIDQSGGFLQVQNRYGSVMWQGNVDYRDGALHSAVVVYNAQAQTITVWVDGVLVNSIGGGGIAATADFVASTTGSKVTIGAMGGTADTARYAGFWSAMMYIPAPVLADNDNRAAVFAALAAM